MIESEKAYLRRLEVENYRLSNDFDKMVNTFRHLHVGPHDTCSECGLDLRHPVHFREETK